MTTLDIQRNNGAIVAGEALPICFGKTWNKQPTRTKLWFMAGALKRIGNCHFFSCGISVADLNSLGANNDPRTWLNKAFSEHLRGVPRVLVFEANPKQNPNANQKIGYNDVLVHAHGVLALNGTEFKASDLEARLKAVFTGRIDRSIPSQRTWQDEYAVKVIACDAHNRATGSKFTVVGHAMGAMEYSTKHVGKTKRLLNLTDKDIPAWYNGSEVQRRFPDSADRNHQYFKSIMNSSHALPAKGRKLFDEIGSENALRQSRDFSSLEWKKVARLMREIEPSSAERLIRKGAQIADHQIKSDHL